MPDPSFRLEKLLVPTDFSEHAEDALAYALGLAAATGARVRLLHVLEEPVFPSFYDTGASALYGHVPDLEKRAREELQRLIDELGAGKAGVPVDALVVRGAPKRQIAEVARAEEADLVVIASHGQSGLERLLMGSVAERVVRSCPVPVLVIPSFERHAGSS